jgi:tetratricopeptide (TPR) repeat protein
VAFPAGDKTPVALPAGLTRSESGVDRRTTATSKALVAYGRYEPSKALALTDQPGDRLILKVYRHYARGEAFASRGDATGVRTEADALIALVAEGTKANELGVVSIGGIASDVLQGRAALLAHQPDKAVAFFAKAAASQEKTYPANKNFDPPPWWYPVRRSLAAADLAAGKPDDAIREARAGLKDWPDDALALKVISEAQAKQGHAAEAQKTLAQAKRVWRGDLSKESLDLI